MTIPDNIAKVEARIRIAEQRGGREPGTVALMAVSKTRGAGDIVSAWRAGIRHIGENYLQEALGKQAELGKLPGLSWHFIGPIQSNKCRQVAENFDWVHSIDRLKIAQRLSAQRPANRPPLNICLQVNISGEDSKAGVSPAELPNLAQAVAALPGLQLRGLMAIPAPTANPEAQRRSFAAVRALFESIKTQLPQLDALSMGMSADLEAAIAEGATMVRVGRDIFGPRA